MASQISFMPQTAWQLGAIAPAAKVSFFKSGTSTPLTVYTDEGYTTAHTQPVVADAAGVFPTVFFGGADEVKAVLTASDDSSIATVDPAPKVVSTGAGAGSIPFSPVTGNAATDVQTAIANNAASISDFGTPSDTGEVLFTGTPEEGRAALSIPNLTLAQAIDETNQVFGLASGQRIRQAITAMTAAERGALYDEFTWEHSADVTEIQMTGLGSYSRLEIDIDLAVADIVRLQVSVDNGATWEASGYTASANDGSGGTASTDSFLLVRVAGTAAAGRLVLSQFGSDRKAIAGGALSTGGTRANVAAGSSPSGQHDAFKIYTDSGVSLFTAGTIIVRGFI